MLSKVSLDVSQPLVTLYSSIYGHPLMNDQYTLDKNLLALSLQEWIGIYLPPYHLWYREMKSGDVSPPEGRNRKRT